MDCRKVAYLAGFVAIAFATITRADETTASDSQDAAANAGRPLHVANNGVDKANCGERRSPCRSIFQAISNAQTGDTILIGPGRYGDLNGDSDFDDPGEEHPGHQGCLVCVTKRLRVQSLNGAPSTVIDAFAPQVVGLVNVVLITEDGTTFGGPSKGFTIANSPGSGLLVDSAGDVRIQGNISLNNPGFGFSFTADRGLIGVYGNTAIGNIGTSSGFAIRGPFTSGSSGRVVLIGNKAMRNQNGFFFAAPDGVVTSHRLFRNFASNNGNFADRAGNGVVVGASGVRIEENTLAANVIGMLINEADTRATGNTITGNFSSGVLFSPGAGTGNEVKRNNIYGNAVASCQLENQSDEIVDARNNFWGSTTGPVPPATIVCDVPGPTLIQPIATQAFPIRP